MGDSLLDVRVADLVTFLAVQRTGSITAAARELRVTPSQVSKAVARLERHTKRRLLARSTRGISLTEAGRAMVGRVVDAVNALRALRPADAAAEQDAPLEITVAGPSYLVTHLLPVIANAHPRLRTRGLELPPAYLRAYVTENVFDLALSVGDIEGRPATWMSDKVGEVRAELLAPPALAAKLGPLPAPVDRLRAFPFVVPSAAPSDRFAPLDDSCPLPRDDRRVGHETQTIGAALELAASTNHLVFGPLIAARHYIETGRLVVIPVAGWNVTAPLCVVCNSDRVLASVRKALLGALREHLPRMVP